MTFFMIGVFFKDNFCIGYVIAQKKRDGSFNTSMLSEKTAQQIHVVTLR